jgi:hypothetical protein
LPRLFLIISHGRKNITYKKTKNPMKFHRISESEVNIIEFQKYLLRQMQTSYYVTYVINAKEEKKISNNEVQHYNNGDKKENVKLEFFNCREVVFDKGNKRSDINVKKNKSRQR